MGLPFCVGARAGAAAGVRGERRKRHPRGHGLEKETFCVLHKLGDLRAISSVDDTNKGVLGGDDDDGQEDAADDGNWNVSAHQEKKRCVVLVPRGALGDLKEGVLGQLVVLGHEDSHHARRRVPPPDVLFPDNREVEGTCGEHDGDVRNQPISLVPLEHGDGLGEEGVVWHRAHDVVGDPCRYGLTDKGRDS